MNNFISLFLFHCLTVFSLSAQVNVLDNGRHYEFRDFKLKFIEYINTADSLSNFSVVVKGKIKKARFLKILETKNTEVTLFDTYKLVPAQDTLLVNHVYFKTYFKDKSKAYIFLSSYSEDLTHLTGQQTIFTLLGTTDNDKPLNIFSIE